MNNDYFRIAISEYDIENENQIAHSSFQGIWERELKPLKKKKFINQYGLSLRGVDLKHYPRRGYNGDMEAAVSSTNFGPPLTPSVRFLICDNEITSLPPRLEHHPVLLVLEFSEEYSWDSHPLSSSVSRLKCPAEIAEHHIYDVLLDISFSNSYIPEYIYKEIKIDTRTLLDKKTKFLSKNYKKQFEYLKSDQYCPYLSFSTFARLGKQFGSDAHIREFVSMWDEFYKELTQNSDRKQIAIRLISRFSKFGNRLSENQIQSLLKPVPPGTYLFVARRKSKDFASNSVRNRLNAIHTQLDFRSPSKNDFGLVNIEKASINLLKEIETLTSEDSIYVLRIVV